ncbi:MAG: multicopper oxidase domain-containing protein [Gemmatimonadaceae bacterium]
MLLTFLVVGQLALARGPAPVPAIRPNDNRAAAGQLARGVLTVSLVAQRGLWYPETSAGPGLPLAAFAEEGKPGTAPGPMIRVPAGTDLRVTIRNALEKPMTLRGFQDHGSAALDTFEIAAGATRELRFRANTPGTFLYWGRTEGTPGVIGTSDDALLSGALIVDPPATVPDVDERILVISMVVDTPRAPTPAGEPREREVAAVNGLGWPYTERLDYTVGSSVHWRVINATNAVHPMHLHGFYFTVLSRGDGTRDTVYTESQQRQGVTEFMLPASTMALSWVPTRPGNWLFHCHLIFHIDAKWRLSPVRAADHSNHAMTGMSGLVVGVRVAPTRNVMPAREALARRSLRLLVTERPNVFGAKPGFSFILQEGAMPPAADSVRFPSSTIVLRRHEPTSITVVNRMKTNMASVHWHGIELESYYDGVAGWSGAGERVAPAVAPGDSFVVHMTPDRAGTFIYHTHTDETQQLMSGLYGPLLVLDENAALDTTERLMLIGDGGPTNSPRAAVAAFINGSTDPPPIELRSGQGHRLRLVSISAAHLRRVRLVSESGLEQWRALAKDGADLPPRQSNVRPASVDLGPGETADFEIRRSGREVLTLEIITAPRAAKPHVMRIPVIVR